MLKKDLKPLVFKEDVGWISGVYREPANTPTPTHTSTARSTQTIAPTPSPTSTPAPSSSPTSSPIPTHYPSPSVSPTRTPTPIAVPTLALLPAPKLIKPGNDSGWTMGFVQFEWTWDGNLSNDKWYLIRVGPDPNLEMNTATAKTWESGTSWQTNDVGARAGWYYAYVVVIGTWPGSAESCKPYIYEAGKNVCFREISARSEKQEFYFVPPGSGAPSCPPGHC